MFSRRRRRGLEQQRREYALAAAQHLVAADRAGKVAGAADSRGVKEAGGAAAAPALQIAALKERVRARDDTIACLSCEVQLLRTAISVLKEDLSVKDDQFDKLFWSLRASSEFAAQNRMEREKASEDRLRELETLNRSLKPQASMPVSSATASGFSALPVDVRSMICGMLTFVEEI